ncbi:hypothetical protein [Lactococcus garvieae]|uniref:hypothetical protein n=1 Tax=Lactococcus garvieae TaxID=1363 RepID=UPI00385520E5
MTLETTETQKQGYVACKQETDGGTKKFLIPFLLIDPLTYEELVHHERSFIVVPKTNVSFYPDDTLLLYNIEGSEQGTSKLKVSIKYIWEAKDINRELRILQDRGTTFEKVWGPLYAKHLIDKQGHSKLSALQHLIGFTIEEEQIIS